MFKRQDTKLESEGAEFLVLGNLLVEGITCYKAYVNIPGYDLTAINTKTNKIAAIQVKSRWSANCDKGFPIRNLKCDFVVHVALNRLKGSEEKPSRKNIKINQPEYYVLPVDVVKKAKEQNPKNSWGKVFINRIPQADNYKSNWQLIRDFLQS